MDDSSDLAARNIRLEERLRVLTEATAAFAQATFDSRKLNETVAKLVAEVLNDYCMVQLLSADGTTLLAEAIFSPDPETRSQARAALSVPVIVAEHPIAKRVIETGQPFMASGAELKAMRSNTSGPSTSAAAAFGAKIGIHSMLVVPLSIDDRPLGQLTLARHGAERPPFDQQDLEMAQTLARHASLAMSNAKLLTEARLDLAERSQADRHLRLMAQSSADFSAATHDLQLLLELMARRLGELVGELCIIRQMSTDGQWLEIAGAVYHRDERIQADTRALLQQERQRVGEGLSGQVAATGKAVLIPVIDAKEHARTSALHQATGNRFVVVSSMTVPLISRGRVVGVANLARSAAQPPYTEDDLLIVQGIANYAGLALGNARAYSAEREARASAEAATKAFQLSEARFAHLAESGLVGIIVSRLSDRSVIQINDALLKMIGYSHKQVMSGEVKWSSLTPPEWKAVDDKAIDQLQRTGVGDLREKEYIRSDGRRVPVMAGSAMIDGDEVISFIVDLTERKAAQSTIEMMRREHAADARFRSLLESAPDAMVITDEAGIISLVNGRVGELFGYEGPDLLGRPITSLIQPGPDALASRSRTGPPELIGRRKNRSTFPIEVTTRPLETESGTLISRAIRDVTERRRFEQQRADLAAIVEGSDDAIIGIDINGLVTSWNHGAEKLFGYLASEAIGQTISMLSSRDPSEAHEIAHTLDTGEVQRFDTVRRKKSGEPVNVSVTTSPVRNVRGEIVGVSKVARDITARIKSADALTRAKDAAEAASLELEAFSYSVAHDLRTPLRGMSGFAQVLLDDYEKELDADGQAWLREIMKNAKRMGALIDALLSISRLSRSELKREVVDLSSLVGELMAQLRASDPSRKVEVVIEPHLKAAVDPVLIRALFDNLLSNAWKFTSKAANARIELSSRVVNGELVYELKDNGAGFSMSYAKKLFVAFQRLHGSEEFPGIGIGLATVQRIVRRHGGQISAEGEVGKGATFTFTLGK